MSNMEFDVVVIGSGPGGYVAAIRAAQLKLKTACVEKNADLGGTCLNVGCIPSKALLYSSELYWKCKKEGALHGIKAEALHCDFLAMMARKNKIVSGFRAGIAGLFKKNKVTHLQGTATLLSPHSLRVGSQEIKTKYIILATGSEPTPLPFLPFDEKKILSSTGALALPYTPERMTVVGAGVIGVELGSVYSRLGTQVTFVEFMDRVCPTLEESLSKELQTQLTKQGLTFYLSSKVNSALMNDKEISVQITLPDKTTKTLATDVVLVSIGRRAYTQGLGLEQVGISLTPQGLVPIDGQFRTKVPSIFAIGDIVDGPMLAHKAEEEGIAAAEIIAGQQPHINYAAIPNVVYTYPEVASVGLSEAQAQQFGLSTQSGVFPFKANSRAPCSAEEDGFVKIVVEGQTKRILGMHIIGAHASELIVAGALALQKKMTIDDIIHTPFAHPTLAEAIKEAALAVHNRAIHK